MGDKEVSYSQMAPALKLKVDGTVWYGWENSLGELEGSRDLPKNSEDLKDLIAEVANKKEKSVEEIKALVDAGKRVEW